MSEDQIVNVKLISSDQHEALGKVQLRHWSKEARFKRCMKSFGMIWGMAFCCIFIPVAHFILVPTCLLAGPIVAYFVYQQSDTFQGGSGTCPHCNEPFSIVTGSTLKWPLKDRCSECHSDVEILPV